MEGQFSYQKYLIRRKIFTFMGRKFHVFNPNGEVVIFSKLKAFRLREDIRLYSGEDLTNQLISIHARNIIDISATYDVIDTTTGFKIGALKRRGLKSMVQDEWMILNAGDQEIGIIKEDSLGLALLRRLLTSLVPQSYNIFVGGNLISTFKQNFNPFVVKLNLDFTQDVAGLLDRRLGIAAGILLCAVDGKQQ